jgi:hypothetical protein
VEDATAELARVDGNVSGSFGLAGNATGIGDDLLVWRRRKG